MSDPSTPQPFRSWAIVEQMGHRRIAGLVTADAPLLHATRLVIEVYDGAGAEPAATIGTGYPVYQLTACTEELARSLGSETLRSDMPVSQWDARSLLPRPVPEPEGPRAITGSAVPMCPEGCGCRLDGEDADRRECGCDGPCTGDEDPGGLF